MIWIYKGYEELSQAAAGIFVYQSKEAVRDHGYFSVVLSGGNTPQRLYEVLGSEPYRDRVAWQYVHFFWGDERCVPEEDPRSNARMARLALLDLVPIASEQIYPIPCSVSPMLAAEQYERTLKEFFGRQLPRFDLVLLGLGQDGHTASLFPGQGVVHDTQHWVAEAYNPAQDLWRVTLTPQIINQAQLVAFLVSGEEKNAIVRQVLEGPPAPEQLPAQAIHPENGELDWLLDEAAASLLTQRA